MSTLGAHGPCWDFCPPNPWCPPYLQTLATPLLYMPPPGEDENLDIIHLFESVLRVMALSHLNLLETFDVEYGRCAIV